MNAERAIYIHVPFCISKCFYCDFNSYPGMENLFDGYVGALVREIESAALGPEPLDSAFSLLSGGAPAIIVVERGRAAGVVTKLDLLEYLAHRGRAD